MPSIETQTLRSFVGNLDYEQMQAYCKKCVELIHQLLPKKKNAVGMTTPYAKKMSYEEKKYFFSQLKAHNIAQDEYRAYLESKKKPALVRQFDVFTIHEYDMLPKKLDREAYEMLVSAFKDFQAKQCERQAILTNKQVTSAL